MSNKDEATLAERVAGLEAHAVLLFEAIEELRAKLARLERTLRGLVPT